jgi:hydroxypyruvate isomerase
MRGEREGPAMKFSACIEWLFAEGDAPFPERVLRARAAGLDAVEFWEWTNKDLAGIRDALRRTGLPVASMMSEPTGRLTDRSTHAAFLEGVAMSAEVAAGLGGAALVVLSGDRLEGVARVEQRSAIVDALRAAAPIARRRGVNLLLEPINLEEAPDHYLDSIGEGLDIVAEVDEPNVRLLADLYHAAVMGEDVPSTARGRVGLVGHVHVADHPDRHEPGTGGVDWAARLAWLTSEGYAGYIGLEYMPVLESEASLDHIRALGRAQADSERTAVR